MNRRCRLDIAKFPVSTLVRMVANLLESVIRANDALSTAQSNVTLFHSRSVPGIKISTYLARILKFTPFHNEVLISLLVYFDRIAKLRRGRFALCSLNIHRLLITSIVVASKFTSDVFYPNTRYAKVGGLPLLELNKLEIEFLFLCNFDLRVRLEALQEYGDQLLAHALSQQSLLVELTQLDLVPPAKSALPCNRKRPRHVVDDDNTSVSPATAAATAANAAAAVDNNNNVAHIRFPLTPPYNPVQHHHHHHHHHANILDNNQIIKRRRNSSISIATVTHHPHIEE